MDKQKLLLFAGVSAAILALTDAIVYNKFKDTEENIFKQNPFFTPKHQLSAFGVVLFGFGCAALMKRVGASENAPQIIKYLFECAMVAYAATAPIASWDKRFVKAYNNFYAFSEHEHKTEVSNTWVAAIGLSAAAAHLLINR